MKSNQSELIDYLINDDTFQEDVKINAAEITAWTKDGYVHLEKVHWIAEKFKIKGACLGHGKVFFPRD